MPRSRCPPGCVRARVANAIAAQQAQTFASYTGCPKNCKIDSVALGDALLAPCGSSSR